MTQQRAVAARKQKSATNAKASTYGMESTAKEPPTAAESDLKRTKKRTKTQRE